MDGLKPITAMPKIRIRIFWVLVFGVVASGLATGIQADSTVALQGDSAKARLNLVIHIPETLHLTISHPDNAEKSLKGPLKPGSEIDARQPPMPATVNAAGTVAKGGTMSLSTHASGQMPKGLIKRTAAPTILWTSGGVDSSGKYRSADASIKLKLDAKTHFYSFQHVLPRQADDSGQVITYTLSSP